MKNNFTDNDIIFDRKISEPTEIPEEEVPEDIREYEELLRNAKPWDAPFEDAGIFNKITIGIEKIMGNIFSTCRKYPILSAAIVIISEIYYLWLMVFIIVKCFGSKKTKAKANGKKFITVTAIFSLTVTILSAIGSIREIKSIKKAKAYMYE